MTGIVGRGRELAEIDAALASAQRGRGRLLLVNGAAGIGKSRLAAAAVERAGGLGLPVAVGYAVDDPGAPPLWPWSRALRGRDEIGELFDAPAAVADSDAAARFRLLSALADRIVRLGDGFGLLVVLEDLHWGDELSVHLLRHVAAGLDRQPVVVLATARDGVDAPFARMLGELARGDHARVLGLGELTPAETAEWLPALTGGSVGPSLAVALHERTGGNPLLLRLVAEDLAARPRSGGDPLDDLMLARPHLRRLVVARLAPLTPPSRALVDAAAVLGERLAPELLAEMVGEPGAAVRAATDEALAAGVLSSGADGVRFTHALVRDAAYAELAGSRRATLHERAATALAERHGVEAAGSIAHHWRQAGAAHAERCVAWAEAADDRARSRLAFADALGFARLAVEAARAAGAEDAELARLLVRAAEAAALAHDLGGSIEACAEAGRLAERAGRPELMARAALVVHGTGIPAVLREVQELCERALAALPDTERVLRARLTAQLAVAAAELGAGARAAELAAAALREAEESGDDLALLEAMAARHLTSSVPALVEDRLELGRQAVALGAAGRHPMAALWGHLWRADAALQLGNLAEVGRELAEIDRVARNQGSIIARWHHHRFAAVGHQLAGRYAEARAANAASRQIGLDLGDVSMLGMYYAMEIELAVVRGRPEDLDDDWERAVSMAPDIDLVRLTWPMVHAASGELDLARAELEEFRALPDTYPVGVRWAGTMGQLAVLAALLDDAELAGRLYDVLLPVACYYSGDGSGAVYSHGSMARLVADQARVAGRHDAAVRHYADAAAMNRRIGARPYLALSRLGWGQSLLARGRVSDLGEARALVADAAAEFRRLDMPGPLARADATLLALDRTRRQVSPLSEREREVAALVAEALSNRQIAERLVLSERTVESHVRSILSKLGFTTRTEIATWALRERA